jgi:site-specific recombinase XerD
VGTSPFFGGEPQKRCLEKKLSPLISTFQTISPGCVTGASWKASLPPARKGMTRSRQTISSTGRMNEFDQIRASDIRHWVNEQKRRGIKNRTIKEYLSCLRAFYGHCLDHGLVPENPVIDGASPQRRQTTEVKLPEKTAAALRRYLLDSQSRLNR